MFAPPPLKQTGFEWDSNLGLLHLDWYNQEHNQSIADPVIEENQP